MILLLISVLWLLTPFNFGAWFFLKIRKPPKVLRNDKLFYQSHLLSPKWRKTRLKRLVKDRKICQNCLWWRVIIGFVIKPRLEVHHKTYVRLGKEKQRDLITLCSKCHKKIHKR